MVWVTLRTSDCGLMCRPGLPGDKEAPAIVNMENMKRTDHRNTGTYGIYVI